MLRGLPGSFRELSRKLMRRKGVVGVFWGAHERGRKGPRRIRVHVERKLPPEELSSKRMIPDRMRDLRTCVVESGCPVAQAISASQLLRPDDDVDRVSTVTAVRAREGAWIALACGHGTLPIVDSQLVRRVEDPSNAFEHEARDVSSGEVFGGALLAGGFHPSADWAVLRLGIAPGTEVDTVSAATGRSRAEIRRSQLGLHEPLQHFSCLDREMRSGVVVGFGPVRLRMPDGRRYVFPSVFEVRGNDAPFCREGDSGSLVADENHRAVGIVLGASDPPDDPQRAAFVLPLRLLDPEPRDHFFD